MNIKTIAAIAASVIATTAWAGEKDEAGKKEASCSKKDGGCAKKDASCSKK